MNAWVCYGRDVLLWSYFAHNCTLTPLEALILLIQILHFVKTSFNRKVRILSFCRGFERTKIENGMKKVSEAYLIFPTCLQKHMCSNSKLLKSSTYIRYIRIVPATPFIFFYIFFVYLFIYLFTVIIKHIILQL